MSHTAQDAPRRPAPQSLLRPMRAVLRTGGLIALVAVPVGAGIGFVLDGSAGLWGALLGLAMPLLFFSITAGVALATARLRPDALGVAVLASWLVKIVALIAFLAVISGQDFYNKAILFGFLLLGTIGYLVMEALVVSRTKVLYVEPELAED